MITSFTIHYSPIFQSFFSIHYSPIILPNPLSKYHCSCILPNPLSNYHSFQYSLITTIQCHQINYSPIIQPVPSNPLFTSRTNIQCLIVQLPIVPTAQQAILTFSCCTQFNERSKTTDEDTKSWHEFGRPK